MNFPAFDVAVCGSLHLDIMVQSSHLPRLDETVVGSGWSMKCGGKGGNQAVMAARMGAHTVMISRVGRDDFGKKLADNLDANGVDRIGVGIDDAKGSGMSVAILDGNGDYGAVIVSGSNLGIDTEDAVGRWATLGGARVLVLQNEISESVNFAVARAARESGAKVILNAAPMRQFQTALLDHVDVLVLNRVEAEMMSGTVVQDASSASRAISALERNDTDIIVTLGGEGLVVRPRGEAVQIIAPVSVKMVSSHGAGDCFIGAVSARLSAGDTVLEACRFANRAAAAFVAMDDVRRTEFSIKSINSQ